MAEVTSADSNQAISRYLGKRSADLDHAARELGYAGYGYAAKRSADAELNPSEREYPHLIEKRSADFDHAARGLRYAGYPYAGYPYAKRSADSDLAASRYGYGYGFGY